MCWIEREWQRMIMIIIFSEPRCQFRDQYLLLNVGLKALADLGAQNHINHRNQWRDHESFPTSKGSKLELCLVGLVVQARCKKKVILSVWTSNNWTCWSSQAQKCNKPSKIYIPNGETWGQSDFRPKTLLLVGLSWKDVEILVPQLMELSWRPELLKKNLHFW